MINSFMSRAASGLRATSRLGLATSPGRFASTLVVADAESSSISGGSLSSITAAKKLGGNIDVLVTGKDAKAAAEAAAKIDGVTRVIYADGDNYRAGIAEDLAALILKTHESNNYSHILAASSNFGKNFIPRVAVKLDVAAISDILSVEDENTFTRPMYAGNAIAKVKSNDSVKVATVRGTSFEKAAEGSNSAPVEDAPAVESPGLSRFVSEEIQKSDRPELTSATRVVSGGRGMKNGENFDILMKLADKMGAAVGASRAACDAGWVPNDWQVGQTGKVVAPSLYVAVGISGAIQHLAGMKDSKVIVAINKDEEAPIFQVADYGLVADLFTAVPEMTEKL